MKSQKRWAEEWVNTIQRNLTESAGGELCDPNKRWNTFISSFLFSSFKMFRFDSFAPVRSGRAKWFVDGCDYLACVAEAINKVFFVFSPLSVPASGSQFMEEPGAWNTAGAGIAELRISGKRGDFYNRLVAEPGALSQEKLRCGQRILEAAHATEKESGNGRALHRINYKHLISGWRGSS